MSRDASPSGQLAIVVVVGLAMLAIPVGVALSLSATSTTAGVTPTPPPVVNLIDTPTESPTNDETATPEPTASPTATPTDSPGGSGNDNGDGHRLVVAGNSGVAEGVASEGICSTANYTTIQRAVDDAELGDTVLVCEGTYPEHVEISTDDLTIQANGDATIETVEESAAWINASGVTLQGFDISVGEGADYAIEVGGQDTLIRNNTVEAPEGVGIFLSDGLSPVRGNPDFELGAATGSRILNNTVTAEDFRIWADADQAVIQNNNVTDDPPKENASSYPFPVGNTSIVSSGNETVIRNNSIQYSSPKTHNYDRYDYGIQIGLGTNRQAKGRAESHWGPGRGEGHNWAEDNLVVNNNVTAAPAGGIRLHTVATRAIVRDNSVFKAGVGVNVWSKESVILNNTLTFFALFPYAHGVEIHANARVIGNTITRFGDAIVIHGHGVVINNTLRDNPGHGVEFSQRPHPSEKFRAEPVEPSGFVLNNQIINNGDLRRAFSGAGVMIYGDVNPSQIEIHGNFINSNENLGIQNQNKSVIVNATNNIWACGGPSSGADPLADPYTGRLANGSGDAISGGNGSTRNGHPISNIHFDPFQELSSCPNQTSTPTPTHTAIPTPTPPPDGGGSGDGGGGGGAGSGDDTGDGGGTGSGDGTGNGADDSADSDAPSGSNDSSKTATPPHTSTVTPMSTLPPTPTPTPTPPETPTPTPAVEPGFGMATWLVGFILALSLLAHRRRGN